VPAVVLPFQRPTAQFPVHRQRPEGSGRGGPYRADGHSARPVRSPRDVGDIGGWLPRGCTSKPQGAHRMDVCLLRRLGGSCWMNRICPVLIPPRGQAGPGPVEDGPGRPVSGAAPLLQAMTWRRVLGRCRDMRPAGRAAVDGHRLQVAQGLGHRNGGSRSPSLGAAGSGGRDRGPSFGGVVAREQFR
jgi:hypothetical protein